MGQSKPDPDEYKDTTRQGLHTVINALPWAREFSQQRSAPFQALGRPALGSPIVFCLGGGFGREHNPRLLRCGENVNVGRPIRGFIKSANTNEANGVSCSAVVAPEGDLAYRAT